MKEETVTDAALRQFLLGDVDDEERQRLESLFVTDAQARERILIAEQDLVEDYLEDSLTAADKEKFVSVYGSTPEQRRKLRINKAIKDWAAGEQKATVSPAASSFWGRLSARLGLKPMFVIPVAATVVIAIVTALVWLNSRNEERNQRAALNQEIARLNEPESLRETPSGLAVLRLQPGSLRGVATQEELVKNAGTQIVELQLAWNQPTRYPSYQATIRRVSSNESFTTPPLHPENDGRTIRLRIPARFLTRGLYQIELSGIDAGASASPPEEYQFSVSN